ncbi:ABC transporter permease [Crossiella sp. NPDC003009]
MTTRTVRRAEVGLGVVTGVEVFRCRRGILPWLMLTSPVVVSVPMLIGAAVTGDWRTFGSLTLTGWGTLLPVLIGLLAALSVHQDREAWLFLLASPVDRARLVLGKFLALGALLLAASAVLALTLWIGATETGAPAPLPEWAAVGAMWVSALGVLGLLLLLSLSGGLAVTVGAGALGALSGALTGDKSIWYLNPFGWPLRSMLPFGEVHSSGTPLDRDSPLLAVSPVFAAMGLSLAVAAVAVGLACVVLKRKEV